MIETMCFPLLAFCKTGHPCSSGLFPLINVALFVPEGLLQKIADEVGLVDKKGTVLPPKKDAEGRAGH